MLLWRRRDSIRADKWIQSSTARRAISVLSKNWQRFLRRSSQEFVSSIKKTQRVSKGNSSLPDRNERKRTMRNRWPFRREEIIFHRDLSGFDARAHRMNEKRETRRMNRVASSRWSVTFTTKRILFLVVHVDPFGSIKSGWLTVKWMLVRNNSFFFLPVDNNYTPFF